MRKTPLTTSLKASAAIVMAGLSVHAIPAFAQDAAPAPSIASDQPTADNAPGGDIIVTGSRIQSPNLQSISPITTVNSQDIKLQGTTRVEDLLNTLPSVYAGQTSTLSNGSNGTATVNLRGLGATRTLTLINGRRIVPGDPNGSSAADINIIPSAVLSRVDVLTGGASSTYGADAVAGVVNFVIDKGFTGFRVDGQYSFYQHDNSDRILPPLLDRRAALFPGFDYPRGSTADGGQVDTTVSFGANFGDDKGHVLAYLGYRKINAVTQNRRDYSACTFQTSRANTQCGGSATSAEGNAILFSSGTSTFFTIGAGRTLNPGLTRFNFAPTNYYQRPDERYTAGVFVDYEINEHFKPYMEFMFMDDRTVAQIAPSGDFGNTLTINSDNPLISAQQRSIIFDSGNLINGFLGTFPLAVAAGYNPNPGAAPINFTDPTTGNTYNRAFFQLLRRNVEGAPRQSDLEHTDYRGVFGLKGDVDKAWSYDAYYQYGRVILAQTYLNDFSIRRLTRALDVVSDPNTGAPVCRSALDGSDPACVPYDIFAGRGGASQAAINYLATPGFQRGQTREQVGNISFTGQLGEYGLKTPWASDGVAVNVGFEWRNEAVEFTTDSEFRDGDLSGQGAATLPLSGSYRVLEGFGETNIPVVQDGIFKDLTLNLGYRFSSYSTSSGRSYDTDTYKLGGEFAPVADIRIRGSYSQSVRAPNIQELFTTATVALDGTSDPCSDITITASDYACLAQGLVVGQRTPSNPAGQYNGFLGGNQNLNPETAKSFTVGAVIQPRWIPGFSLSVDYFDISISNAIGTNGADAILADCSQKATATFTPASCALVHRDPSGSIWLTPGGFVNDLNLNTGGVETRGTEINAGYSTGIGKWGKISAVFQGTYLHSYFVDNGLTEPFECAGLYGPICSANTGGPVPNWKHKARVTWTSPKGFSLSGQWRYIGAVVNEQVTSNPSLANTNLTSAAANVRGRRIPSYSYFDIAATAKVADHYNFRIGVNNAFDIQPPLVPSAANSSSLNGCASVVCNGNTYPGTYDALGRYIYLGMTLDF